MSFASSRPFAPFASGIRILGSPRGTGPGRFLPGRERSRRRACCSLPGGFEEWLHRQRPRRSTMTSRKTTTFRAVARFALVAAASAAAASLWAQVRPECGLLLDAQTWREEVVTASTGPWPEEGWFRLVPRDHAV